MRNLKKLLAVIVAVCVLATMSLTAFADDATKTPAQVAEALGVIQGSGNGVTADYLAQQPDRLQGAIMFLRLKGLESAAIACTSTDNFADVAGLNSTNTAILAYLHANPNIGYEGIGDNKFDPLTKMTAKQYYKVLLVALGYTYDATGTDATKDFNWTTVLQFAASKGLTKLIDNEKFTVNDLAIGTVEALQTTLKDGSTTLLGALVEAKVIPADKLAASGLSATPTALSVVSATADNLKVAKFVFSKELDSATVVAANFTVGGVAVDSAILQDDKKTVSVVMSAAQAQNAATDIVVKGVKGTDGTTIADTTKTVTFIDQTIPVVSGAVAKNAKAIVVSVSEPVQGVSPVNVVNYPDITIDGAAVNATSTFDYAKNTLTLNLIGLLSTGSHKISVGGLTDYAGYKAIVQTFNIDVAADTTAPAIASATVASTNEIDVTFNEDLQSIGSFTVNGSTAIATQDTSDNSKVILTGFTALNIGATVEINIKYQDQTDVVGNKTPASTYTFKIADDTSLPTVTASMGTDNTITLTFSKNVVPAGTLKIFKADGTTVFHQDISIAPSANTVWTGKTVVAIAPAATGLSPVDAQDIKIMVTGVVDATVRANAMADATIALKANDTKAPEVLPAYTVTPNTDATKDTITFYFTEPIQPATLKSLANYYVTTGSGVTTGRALSAISGASLSSAASDNTSVTFVVPSVAHATGVSVQVYGQLDIAGNAIATTSVSATPVALAVSNVELTGAKEITVTFNHNVKTVLPGAFFVTDATGSAVKSSVYATAITDNKVALSLGSDVGTVGTGLYLKLLNASYVQDFYGQPVTPAAILAAMADKAAPTATVASTSQGIIITFSEDTDAATRAIFASSELVLQNGTTLVEIAGTVTGTWTDAKTYVIKGLSANTAYSVQLVNRTGGLKDVNGNAMAPLAATSVTTGW